MRFVKIIRLFMELHLHLRHSTHILLPLLLHRHLLIFTVFNFVEVAAVAIVVIVVATGVLRVKLFKALIIVLVYEERSV